MPRLAGASRDALCVFVWVIGMEHGETGSIPARVLAQRHRDRGGAAPLIACAGSRDRELVRIDGPFRRADENGDTLGANRPATCFRNNWIPKFGHMQGNHN